MKKVLLLVMLVVGLFAEMSFDQVQDLIKNKQYTEALIALDVIEKKYPNESIVYYVKSQAWAGLGDLRGAKIALDKAKALNPKLSYAKPEAVKALEIAMQPRAELVQTFERADKTNYGIYGFIIAFLIIIGFWYFMYRKPKDNENNFNSYDTPSPTKPRSPVFDNDYIPAQKSKTDYEFQHKAYKVHSEPTTDHSVMHKGSPTKWEAVRAYRENERARNQTQNTFSRGYGVKHSVHDSATDSIIAGVAGVALGATVANLMNQDDHKEVHNEVKTESAYPDYLSKPYSEPLVSNDNSSSWGDSKEAVVLDEIESSSSSDSWGDSNGSSSDSWGDSNGSSSDSWGD